MPRLLLVNPSSTHKGLGNLRATSWPPLNLPYLAAVTPSHYQIDIIDENIEPFEYREADILGITAYTSSVDRAYQIAKIYREKGVPTVIGGIHVSMLPEEALIYCDAVVIGEAEGIWPKVLEDFEAGKLKKEYHGTWLSLESLPVPRRDILQNSYYKWGSLQTSRGCPHNCSFCSVTAFNGRRFRRRPLDQVIEELEQIPQKKIILTDDNIIGHGKKDLEWTKAFFSKILEKGIKKFFFTQSSIIFGEDPELLRLASRAGLKIALIGIESINPKTLQSYGKSINLKNLRENSYHQLINKIRKAGIAVVGTFVLGSDEDDLSVFHTTLEFIKSSKLDILQLTKPTPLPGTQLWETLQNEKRIILNDFPADWHNYRLSKMVYQPEGLSVEDVYQGFTYIKKIYYRFFETFKRTLSTLLATKSIKTTIIAYYFNASYRKAFRASEPYHQYKNIDLAKKFAN